MFSSFLMASISDLGLLLTSKIIKQIRLDNIMPINIYVLIAVEK
jgi:hypothetical protein